jgi:hypothetical protein
MWIFTRRFVTYESDCTETGYSAVSRSVLRSSLLTRAAVEFGRQEPDVLNFGNEVPRDYHDRNETSKCTVGGGEEAF